MNKITYGETRNISCIVRRETSFRKICFIIVLAPNYCSIVISLLSPRSIFFIRKTLFFTSRGYYWQ
jgi:hypothetical protein